MSPTGFFTKSAQRTASTICSRTILSWKFGIAIKARMAMTARTTISSMSVKPRAALWLRKRRLCQFLLLHFPSPVLGRQFARRLSDQIPAKTLVSGAPAPDRARSCANDKRNNDVT